MKSFIKLFFCSLVIFVSSFAPSFSQTAEIVPSVDFGALYMVSLDNGRSAAAVSASVPVFTLRDFVGVRSVTFNIDAIGLATRNTTALTAGGSVTIEGLNNSAFQIGVAYVPVDNMKFSAYFKFVGARF